MTPNKKFITNAFSINMLSEIDGKSTFSVEPTTPAFIPADVISAIGHKDIAEVVSADLGFKLEPNRINIMLDPKTTLYVAQYIGPRLPEGATTLPEGATIKYYKVELI